MPDRDQLKEGVVTFEEPPTNKVPPSQRKPESEEKAEGSQSKPDKR